MSIISLKNRINKRVELERYKRDFTDIGSFIKEKRKELRVTQDEISNGICSISYLSKIENNQIIPNDFYVKEIMEKLDVDQAVYSRSLREKEYLEKVISAYFYMEDNVQKEVYEEIKDIEHNLVINLCKLGYTVYFGLEDENQYVMMLQHLVNNMSDYEVKVYLFFASIFFIANEKYKTALELILLNQKLPNNNELLDGMFYEISYHVKQRLLVKNCSTEDYYCAMNIYNKHHNVKKIIYLALRKARNIAVENPKQALKILKTIKVKGMSLKIIDLYFHTKAEVLYNLKRYNESTLALKKMSDESEYYLRKMTLLLRNCLVAKDYDMIDNIKHLVSKYKPTKREMKSKVFYHYLLQTNESERKEYLRDIAIPFSIRIEDYDTLEEYTDYVMKICIDNSRYKEATQYYKKYQKEISKVKKIMY